MKIRIAARKSDLARLQAYTVGRALLKSNPDLKIDYSFSSSLGDINLTDPLWKMPEKGVFTQDLTVKLLSGDCDVVVHSWKDLPTENHPDTTIIATLPREDVRDLILFKRASLGQVYNQSFLQVLTSSPRRAHHLKGFLGWALPRPISNIQFQAVRGNIATRIQKLLDGEAHALVLAKAAIDRLLASEDAEFSGTRNIILRALEDCEFMVVPLSVCPGAPAQGALAVEALRSRGDLQLVFDTITSHETMRNVVAERKLFSGYGGGCHQKIGISQLSYPFGDVLFAQGVTDDGFVIDRRELLRDLNSRPEKVSRENAFPLAMKDSPLYTRESLAPDLSPLKNESHFIFVAKDEALPAEAELHPAALVWAAGTRTWRKLARKGFWVAGTQDSLGEETEMHMNFFLKARSIEKKIKLSHDEAPETSGFRLLPTYRLIDKDIPRDLRDKTDFFWASYSTFKRAVKAFPNIKNARHACGPGHTFELIRKELGPESDVSIFLTYQEWRDNVLAESQS